MSKSMNPHILDQETLKEIFEIRLVPEIGMAYLLFKRITKNNITELKEIVKNEPPAAQYHLFNIDHEIAFHGKLYEITGNDTLKKFQKMLLPVFNYVHKSGLLKNKRCLKLLLLIKRSSIYLKKELPKNSGTACAITWKIILHGYLNNSFAVLHESNILIA